MATTETTHPPVRPPVGPDYSWERLRASSRELCQAWSAWAWPGSLRDAPIEEPNGSDYFFGQDTTSCR